MISQKIERYITKRYDRWLDYAVYHCTHAGIADEAIDVLNEVLLSLVRKENAELERLFDAKKNGYTELDFFVLRMIKLNATSDTSPYRSKYKPMPIDANVDYNRLDIEDTSEEAIDGSSIIVERFHLVRETLNELDLSPKAKRIFEFKFFEDGNFSEWEGVETLKQLYEVYNGVLELIKKKIKGDCLF